MCFPYPETAGASAGYQWFEDHAHEIDPGAPAADGHTGEHM